MKKFLPIGLAGLLVMVIWIIPAMADVNVLADITKTKTITILETVTVDKDVTMLVRVIDLGTVAAEADAQVNQVNASNMACENCAEKVDTIEASVIGNSGITNVNQAAGNMNNQGNVVAVAVDHFTGPGKVRRHSGFANAQTSVDQKQGFYLVPGTDSTTQQVDQEATVVFDPQLVDSVNILFRTSEIFESVIDNVGITNVNQAAGQLNNQANATSLAECLDGSVALSETDLGQATISDPAGAVNTVLEVSALKDALIEGSILGNQGITFVNQSSGNLANQGNALGLSVAIHP